MADVKLTVLCTVYQLAEKNEDGDSVNRNYYTGDTVSVRSAVAETLLKMENGGRPLFKRVNDDDPEEKDVLSEIANEEEKSDKQPRVPAKPSNNDK